MRAGAGGMRSGGGNGGAAPAPKRVADGGARGRMDIGRAWMVDAGFGRLAWLGRMAGHGDTSCASNFNAENAEMVERGRRELGKAGLSFPPMAAGRRDACGTCSMRQNTRRRHPPSRFGLHPAIGGARTERRAAPQSGWPRVVAERSIEQKFFARKRASTQKVCLCGLVRA